MATNINFPQGVQQTINNAAMQAQAQEDAAAFAARDGFGALSAVAGNLVFPLDDDIASRWGPRS